MSNIVDFNKELSKRKMNKVEENNKEKSSLRLDNILKLLKLVERGVVSNVEIICDMEGKTYYLGESDDTYIRKASLVDRVNTIEGYVNIFN